MPVTLTREQADAVDYLTTSTKRVRSLGGLAGTGKSTLVVELIRRLPRYAVVAYTGKAAAVLRRKGVAATTIHSRVYKPHEVEWVDEEGKHHVKVAFTLRDRSELPCDGFIIDEGSMVGRSVFDDLVSYNLPIIVVGDHGQLEPVGDADFNLMACPDVTLEQVHRNAGEIAHFANFIRQGNPPLDWKRQPGHTGDAVRFTSLEEMSRGMVDWDGTGQIICARNVTRMMLNQTCREYFGYPPDHPVPGDRVMCLQNDHGRRLYNGQQGLIKAVLADEMVFTADGQDYRVEYVREAFNQEKRAESRYKDGRLPFDYAYCITCHKAQGDEFDEVMVLEQRCGIWDHKRWAYTAASRARERLTWVAGT
jgi:exodeoxyribonuclease-5